MTRTYTYRVARIRKPQRERLNAMFRHLSWLRNQAVQRCRDQYAAEKTTPSFYDLCKWLTALRKDARDAQWNVAFQRSALKRVALGYQKFFRERKGLPRFKRVRSCESGATKPRPSGQYWTIQVKGVGKLRFKDRRRVLEADGIVRLVRILQTPLGTGYEVQLVMDLPDAVEQPDMRAPIGIDLGVKTNCTLSGGTQYAPIVLDDVKRKRAQRRLSRAKRGSLCRRKKKVALAKESRRIAVRRTNAAHRITTSIINQHSANLVLEDLKLKNMTAHGGSRKRGLNRAILSQCLGEITNQLAYKAESAGGQLVKVSPHHTTQTCSQCGGHPADKITLAVRTYRCALCGLVLDRDVNAARNIRAKGIALFGWPGMQPACRAEAAPAAHGRPLGPASAAPKPSCDTGTRGRELRPRKRATMHGAT